MELPPTEERTRWRRFLNDRVLKVLAALGVVAAAAVIVPTLTSEPRRDEEAVRAAGSSTTIALGDDPADASIQHPTEPTARPSPDRSRTPDPTTAGVDGSTSTTLVGTTGGSSVTTSPSPASSVTSSTTSTTTSAPASCGGGPAAELSCLFDQYRRTEGLPAMSRSGAMDQRAQAWAEKMASDGAMSHSDLNLIFSSCGGCRAVAENVGFNRTPVGAWQAWLGSDTHRNNIRTAKAGVYGIGSAKAADGTLWVVQMFGFR